MVVISGDQPNFGSDSFDFRAWVFLHFDLGQRDGPTPLEDWYTSDVTPWYYIVISITVRQGPIVCAGFLLHFELPLHATCISMPKKECCLQYFIFIIVIQSAVVQVRESLASPHCPCPCPCPSPCPCLALAPGPGPGLGLGLGLGIAGSAPFSL